VPFYACIFRAEGVLARISGSAAITRHNSMTAVEKTFQRLLSRPCLASATDEVSSSPKVIIFAPSWRRICRPSGRSQCVGKDFQSEALIRYNTRRLTFRWASVTRIVRQTM